MFLASEVEPPIHVVLWLLGASGLQLCIGTNGAIAGETDVSRDEIHKEMQDSSGAKQNASKCQLFVGS